jgi:DNA-binding PucR family transcriptional regulator
MLLAEPLLKGTLVGGGSGLGRQVSWALPLSEVDGGTPAPPEPAGPDLGGVVVHLPARQLTADAARVLMDRLVRRGAAALLAWPGRDGARPDLAVASRAADAVGVPLLLLPREADFHRVSHLVAMKVLAQTAHVLEYSQRVHRTLGEVFAHGSGLSAMARTMAQLSRTPVLILGVGGEVLASADMTRPAGSGIDPALGPTLVNQLIALHRRQRGDEPVSPHAETVTVDLDGGPLNAVVAPVLVAGEPFGVVALVERVWPAEEHDVAQHTVIAEQGATLAGSELLRQRSVREAEERARDDFVDALLHGRFTDSHELAARARHYRFDPEARFAVFVVTAPHLAPDRRADAQRASAAARAAAQTAPREQALTLTTLIGSMIVVVRQLPAARGRRGQALAVRDALRGFADQLHRAMRDRLGDEVRIAYGRGGTGAAGVARSYREARTAVALGQRVDSDVVSGYDDLRVFAAIQEVAASGPGATFADEVLGPLRKADGQTASLEQIVLAYIAESGNLNAAARRLQLHRNTMLYKLDRASRALQMDVRSSETQFMVWLAHHIDTLNEVRSTLASELAPPS